MPAVAASVSPPISIRVVLTRLPAAESHCGKLLRPRGSCFLFLRVTRFLGSVLDFVFVLQTVLGYNRCSPSLFSLFPWRLQPQSIPDVCWRRTCGGFVVSRFISDDRLAKTLWLFALFFKGRVAIIFDIARTAYYP